MVLRYPFILPVADKMVSGSLDGVFSFFMTVGSPALAAYSLQITHLNTCWLTDTLLDLEYPNSEVISIVISAFQHVPI